MKKVILIFSLLIATASRAQVTLTGTSSQSLPAFFIIDKEPKSVAPVTDPNKLAATLLNVFDQKGGLKPDVAIEFAPFWLRDSSKMQLVNLTSGKSRWQSLAFSVATSNQNAANASSNGQRLGMGFRFQPFQTFDNNNWDGIRQILTIRGELSNALSYVKAAYTTPFASKASSVAEINAKIGASILFNALSDRTQKTSSENNRNYLLRIKKQIPDTTSGDGLTLNNRINAALNELSPIDQIATVNSLRDFLVAQLAPPMVAPNNQQKAIEELNNAIKKVIRETGESNSSYLTRLVNEILSPLVKSYNLDDFFERNWKFEIAGATGIRFPTNDIGFSYISRVGVWANFSYIFRNENQNDRQVASLNIMGRILSSFSDSVTTNFDLGASFTAKWWKSLPVSLEFVGRHYTYEYDDINQAGDTISRIDRKNTYRLALTADFAIDKDLSLNFTFGRDYDKPFQTSGNLLGIFGLNYTFGTRNKLTN